MSRIANLSNAPRRRVRCMSTNKDIILTENNINNIKTTISKEIDGEAVDYKEAKASTEKTIPEKNMRENDGNRFRYKEKLFGDKEPFTGVVLIENGENSHQTIGQILSSIIDFFSFDFRLRNIFKYWSSIVMAYITIYTLYKCYPIFVDIRNWSSDKGWIFHRVSPDVCYEFTRNYTLKYSYDHHLLSKNDYERFDASNINYEVQGKEKYDAIRNNEKEIRRNRIEEEEIWRYLAKLKAVKVHGDINENNKNDHN